MSDYPLPSGPCDFPDCGKEGVMEGRIVLTDATNIDWMINAGYYHEFSLCPRHFGTCIGLGDDDIDNILYGDDV